MPSVYCSTGHHDKDMDPDEMEIERIDEAEFRNKRTHHLSMAGASISQQLCEGYYLATSRKYVASASKKISSTDLSRPFSHLTTVRPCKSSSFAEKGNNDKGMDHEEFEIEKIDKYEFRNKKTSKVPKIRTAAWQKSNDVSSDTTSRNTTDWTNKNLSFSPKNVDDDSDHGMPNKSSSVAGIVNGTINEDMGPHDIETEGTDEVEFIHQETCYAPTVDDFTWKEKNEGFHAVKSWNNVDRVRKNSYPDGLCGVNAPKDVNSDSDQVKPYKLSPSAETGNGDEDMNLKVIEIEKIDGAEFRNKNTHSMPRIGPSIRQNLNDRDLTATSRKYAKDVPKKQSAHDYFNSLSSEDVSGDTNRDLDKASSFVEKEAMNQAEDVQLEKIAENKKISGSIYLKRKKNAKELDKNLNTDSSSCSDEWINSNLSLRFDNNLFMTDKINFYPHDYEIFPCSPEHENNFSIAKRTRSKTRILKQSPNVNDVALDESTKYSSSSESAFESIDDEDFEIANSFLSDTGELQCRHVEEFDVRHTTSKVSAVNSEDCNRQRIIKHASEREFFYDLHKEGEESNQYASQEQEFFILKKGSSSDASIKSDKEGTSYKPNEAPEENDDRNTDSGDDANEKELFEKRSNRIRENLPKCPCSEKLCIHKDFNVAGINVFHSDYLKDENSGNKDDDGVQRGCRKAVSGTHGHDKKSEQPVNEYTNCLPKRKEFSSNYDFCRVLADSVLERGQTVEDIESNQEAKLVPISQNQNTIPLKFRFEDEAPKPAEETEYEKEIECLFSELDSSWALLQLDSFNFPEVHDAKNVFDEDSQHARCDRGKHELILQDDIGLRCLYCPHVELGPRDIMPMWAEKSHGLSERMRPFGRDQPPEFEKLHLACSMDDIIDFNNSGNGTVWNIKPEAKESMYKHQQEGFEFLWKNLAGSINLAELRNSDPCGVGGCIISHAPGTGKTRLTIVFIETFLKLFPNCRPMIIAPASMLLTWEEEFRKWNVEFPFHNLNNMEFFSNETKTTNRQLSGVRLQNKELIRMVKIYSWNKGRSILGISYSLFEKLAGKKCIAEKLSKKRNGVTIDNKHEALKRILLEKPGLVILDEGHTPRNERSNIWNALLKLHTEKRVILSGTPFQNNFTELFNTLRLVRPAFADVLEQEKIFAAEMIMSKKMSSKKKYEGGTARSSSISKVIDSAVEKLKLAMSPFVHVHKGTILQQSLPGLRDSVVLLKPTALQKILIERIEGLPSTFEFEHKVALISVHPYLLQFCGSNEKECLGIDLAAVEASRLNPNEGVKTKFIFELVRLSLAMNEKVLIFSQYIHPLELIKDQLKEIFKWVDGKQIFQMKGKLDQRQRQIMINIFNNPESEAKVMLASTRCCSEGISLVGASRLILLDVVWNPSVERQAISRAYRIGQKKIVYTYHLMTSGTTEGDKYCRQAEKERLSELVFTSSSNENEKHQHPAVGIEDRIIEEMADHLKLKEMFEKIINQPKDTDLIHTFGPIS